MNISQIKSNIQQGFARPNLFRVSIAHVDAAAQPVFQVNCYQAQIPGSNIATTDKDTGFRSAAYHKLYADTILGFYCSQNMQELNFFQGWVDRIVDPVTNRKGYYSTDTKASLTEDIGYTTTVTIEQLSRLSKTGGEVSHRDSPKLKNWKDESIEKELYDKNWKQSKIENDVIAKWTLFEAYPKQVDPIQLDYGTNDTVMTMNVTLTYRNFVAEFDPFKWRENDGLSDFDTKVLGRKDWKHVDKETGAYKPNKYGTWSSARQDY